MAIPTSALLVLRAGSGDGATSGVGVRSCVGDELAGSFPKFPDGARLGETASSLWNKVLQASLSFVGACSGAGVGSASSCARVSVASMAGRLPVVASHAWSHKVIATCLSLTELSGDLKKNAVF